MKYAAAVLIVYAMFAFVIAEPNPFAWTENARHGMVVVCVMACMIALGYKALVEEKQ